MIVMCCAEAFESLTTRKHIHTHRPSLTVSLRTGASFCPDDDTIVCLIFHPRSLDERSAPILGQFFVWKTHTLLADSQERHVHQHTILSFPFHFP